LKKLNSIDLPPVFYPLTEPYQYKVVYGGRGGARSWTIAQLLLIKGSKQKRRVLCTRELQKSIKQSVHKLLRDQISRLHLERFYTVTESSIIGLNGTEFMFLGIRSNPEEVKSTEGITDVWVEEAENLSESSWDILDPTIRTEGVLIPGTDMYTANCEIYISFNTRFKFDHIYKTFVVDKPPPNSKVIFSSYKDNPWFPSVLRVKMDHMMETNYEKYLNIWLGQLKQLAEGAIYGKQIIQAKKDNKILDFPITNGRVNTFWDLGKNNQTCIWFMQKVGLQYRFIDYYECRLEEISHYCKVISGQADITGVGDVACPITTAVNARRKKYHYEMHYMPHDVEQRILGMKKTRHQQFLDGGVDPIEVVPVIKSEQEGIELTRDMFPECYFHGTNCERGIDALSNFRYVYNEDDDTYKQRPHADWSKNGADAFRQFPQGYRLKTKKKDHRRNRTDHRGKHDAGAWMT
jgi:phage terminase large subunit